MRSLAGDAQPRRGLDCLLTCCVGVVRACERAQVEARLRQLEGKVLASEGARPRGKEQPQRYDKTKQAGTGALAGVHKAYNAAADAVPVAAAAPAAKVGR